MPRIGPKLRRPPKQQPLRTGPTTHYEVQSLRLRENPVKSVQALISRKHLQNNIALIKSIIGEKTHLCAVVKANAYGHDARLITAAINDKVHSFAVATFEEAQDIFPFALDKPILIMTPLFSGMDPHWLKVAQIKKYHCTICSPQALNDLQNHLSLEISPLNLHLKIDTGMGRCGIDPQNALNLHQTIAQNNQLNLAGVYTHFASSDQPDAPLTQSQLNEFKHFLIQSNLNDNVSVIKHACNTDATLNLPQAHFDEVRCGLGLYGYSNAASQLQPILKVQAPLVQIKRLQKGQSSGYDGTFIAPNDMTVGIIPIGYADGLSRIFSNRITLKLGSYLTPVIGRISMNTTVVDLTAVPAPQESDWITILDDQPNSPCGVSTLAKTADTIAYEILTNLNPHIKRILSE